MIKMFPALLLGIVQIVNAVHGPGGYTVCLSCPTASHPRGCQTFAEYGRWSDVPLKDLACLFGEEVSGLPHDTSIRYCNEGEYCYAGRSQSTRPHTKNYGCSSQVVCEHLLRVSSGSTTLCQRCCSVDGCNAHICHEQVQGSTSSAMDTTLSARMFTDCWDMQHRGGFQETGVYDIYPAPNRDRLRVRCDMTTDWGGWTVLQRRYDGSVNFTRTFQEYEEGFGDVLGEYWTGLQWMYILTSQGAVQMRVDLCAFSGEAGYAVYGGFSVSDGRHRYMLHVGRYINGSVENRLRRHESYPFQITQLRGGWWSGGLGGYFVDLNGGPYNGGSGHGIMWLNFGGDGYHRIRSSEMKVRPLTARGDPSRPYTCPP